MTKTLEHMSTEQRLLAMWQENTGQHMLDSGGAYGRNWQRNAGKTVADMLEKDGYFERDYYCTANTFAFLLKHLTYTKQADALTASFRNWVDGQPEGDAYYNSADSLVRFLETVPALHAETKDDLEPFNTYNWDNVLDSVLQGVVFMFGDDIYTALSYHGGADVRGGYTDFVFFESCSTWVYQTDTLSLWCDACSLSGDYRGGDTSFWVDGEELEPTANYDLGQGCPKCKGDWTVGFDECSEW